MIRVTVELLPYGSAEGRKTLGVLDIANDGMGSYSLGSYWGQIHSDCDGRRWSDVRIEDFPRTTLTVWDLIFRILREQVGERNDLPSSG